MLADLQMFRLRGTVVRGIAVNTCEFKIVIGRGMNCLTLQCELVGFTAFHAAALLTPPIHRITLRVVFPQSVHNVPEWIQFR